MSKTEPTIQKYMTHQPIFIEYSRTLADADTLMSEFKIRHLPVMKDGVVTGIISDRDLKMISGIIGFDPGKIASGDLCQNNPFQVEPTQPVREVVEAMAENHYGSAIVVQNKKLVGIFTMSDACMALVKIIAQRYHAG